MADDLANRGRQDRKRISLVQEWELRYWCDKFGCTEAMLREAVEKVGHMAEDVDRYLTG